MKIHLNDRGESLFQIGVRLCTKYVLRKRGGGSGVREKEKLGYPIIKDN